MKSREVLKLLNVTRQTLVRYVELGYISANKLPNGRYDYDKESIYKFLNKHNTRYTCAYIRNEPDISKPEKRTAIERLTAYCQHNNINLYNIYTDTLSDKDLVSENSDFILMLDAMFASKIECLIIQSEKDIQCMDFNIFRHILEQCACKLIILK